MWPRVVEVMLGCWLAISPATFLRSQATVALWIADLLVATLVICLALASFWPPLRRAHLAIVAIALWLIGSTMLVTSYPAPPPDQNHLVVGILLLMFAVIPSHASDPPAGWRAPPHELKAPD